MKAVLFPGQGAQFKGMGRDLFARYPELTSEASETLGYSIKKLCLEDSDNQLSLTKYTQPALYVVNALGYKKLHDDSPSKLEINYFAGHSLGEFNALLAANSFDFTTGLKLVQKRGSLMGEANNGKMAAVLGVKPETITEILSENNLQEINLANFNTSTQTVISGESESIIKAEKIFTNKNIRCIILNVTAAFHSQYMIDAEKKFSQYLNQFNFTAPTIPVIANATARPYEVNHIAQIAGSQITSSVLWSESIRYLMGQNVEEYIEVGSRILTKMVEEITSTESPLVIKSEEIKQNLNIVNYNGISTNTDSSAQSHSANKSTAINHITAEMLGSRFFRQRYGIKYSYVTGGMYKGVASSELVVRMGKANLMGFFGTGGLSLNKIEENIQVIQSKLANNEVYGMNLVANYEKNEMEMEMVNLFLRYNIRNIEAAAFMQITPALALFRIKGISRDNNGNVICSNNIMAKVSRPEVAEVFLSPPSNEIVSDLLTNGHITTEQAALAKNIPVCSDLCVEADSGGHTDRGVATVLLPTMIRQKNTLTTKYKYSNKISVGLAGGIGTPEAAASAFIMGADFVLTGSINQCTVEAGISEDVKNLLQNINVQDTEYAPAADLFEMDAKIQVLRKGVFFPARANKLHSLYMQYDSLESIPEKIQQQLENRYFKKSFAVIWNETKKYLQENNRLSEINKAESNSKFKMSLVFKWYFAYSTRIALEGDSKNRIDYQVQTGPALGAFNQWVKGSKLEPWTNRHTDEIAELLMRETATLLNNRYNLLIESTTEENILADTAL